MGVAKSRTRLSDFTFTFHFHALEKEMATHSSVLAWRIPGTEAWWAAVWGRTESDMTDVTQQQQLEIGRNSYSREISKPCKSGLLFIRESGFQLTTDIHYYGTVSPSSCPSTCDDTNGSWMPGSGISPPKYLPGVSLLSHLAVSALVPIFMVSALDCCHCLPANSSS